MSDYDTTMQYATEEWAEGWFVIAPRENRLARLAGPFREERDADCWIRNAQDRACGL